MTQKFNAISDHPVKLPEIIATTNEVKSSSIKKWGGGYLSISYDYVGKIEVGHGEQKRFQRARCLLTICGL